MLSSLKILPATNTPHVKIPILLVSAQKSDSAPLRQILYHDSWSLHAVANARDAHSVLNTREVAVVLCDRDLPDGTWKDILRSCSNVESSPMLLVTSHDADGPLWAEVLNLGGYDVLLKPFEKAEVLRVVGMASRNWQRCQAGVARVGATSPIAQAV